MSTFYNDLMKIIPQNLVIEHNIVLNDPILTVGINGMIKKPVPTTTSNPQYSVDYLLIFDIEFYTISSPKDDLRKALGLVTKVSETDKAHFVREYSMLVLERKYDFKKNIMVWIIKSTINFDVDSGTFYQSIFNARKNKNLSNLSAQMLGTKFLTTSNNFGQNLSTNVKKRNIKILDESGFISGLNIIGVKANEKNYLNFSYYPTLQKDKELLNYYDALKNTYVNDQMVLGRMLNKQQTIDFFNLFNAYKYKISFLHKGENDLNAINNTFKLFNDKLDVVNYFDAVIDFENTYDIAYFNGMSHILFGSAQLKATCDGVFLGNFFGNLQKIREQTIYKDIYEKFYEFVVGIMKKTAHDPTYDALCTFLSVLIINIAIYIVFNKNTLKSTAFWDLYVNMTQGKTGGGNYFEKYVKYKNKYLGLKK